jgi:hypothetical protein
LAEYRIWTDAEDNVMEAEFVCMAGGKVVIRDRSGKEYKFQPESLIEEDRRYVQSRIPPEVDINVSKITANAGRPGSNSMDWSQCVVTIRQTDTRPYDGELMACLLVLSEDSRSGTYTVASRREKKFQLPERGGPGIEFTSERVGFHRSSQKGGNKYSGYLVVIKDKHGQIVAVKSNRAIFEELAGKLIDQHANARFDSKGQSIGK